jgi:hypothetical protein
MHRLCHRCDAELAGDASGRPRETSSSDDDRALFCSRCGAPQILLPSYLRAEEAEAASAADTTGAVPPPRPQLVEWAVALGCALPVAIVTALCGVGQLFNGDLFFLLALCVFSGPSLVLGLYRARRPLSRIDGRAGLRVGLLTGLMIVACTWTALSATGIIERFVVHGMAAFDEEFDKEMQVNQKMTLQILGSNADPSVLKQQERLMAMPAYRSSIVLLGLSMQAGMLLLVTTGLGAFAGLLQSRRRVLPHGD